MLVRTTITITLEEIVVIIFHTCIINILFLNLFNEIFFCHFIIYSNFYFPSPFHLEEKSFYILHHQSHYRSV